MMGNWGIGTQYTRATALIVKQVRMFKQVWQASYDLPTVLFCFSSFSLCLTCLYKKQESKFLHPEKSTRHSVQNGRNTYYEYLPIRPVEFHSSLRGPKE